MRRKLAENLKRVRERIAQACAQAGRNPESVQLVAVTKTVEMDVIRQLVDMGVMDLGESRVQQLVKRAGMLHEFLSRQRLKSGGKPIRFPRWHMVGQLQRNKIKHLLPHVSMIQSVDNLRLAEDLNTQLGKAGRTLNILLEVNAGGEKTKGGVAVGAVSHLADQFLTLKNLRLCGLMTMAPLTGDKALVRGVFARLREIFEEMVAEGRYGPDFCHLSMGMSNDFEEAILEGATIVRIGTALFDSLGSSTAVTQRTDSEQNAWEGA